MKKIIPPEITAFETFLKTIGFKRADGAIFGLLTLSPEPLSSEEIGEQLGRSQGAVSQGLKTLTHWGAVQSRYSPERRVHLHTATPDSLAIVSSIFQKREKGAIETFRRANETARDRFLAEGAEPDSLHVQRLNSYITTCAFAQVVMDFAITLSRGSLGQTHYSRVIRLMPRVLAALMDGPKTLGNIRREFIQQVKERTRWA